MSGGMKNTKERPGTIGSMLLRQGEEIVGNMVEENINCVKHPSWICCQRNTRQ